MPQGSPSVEPSASRRTARENSKLLGNALVVSIAVFAVNASNFVFQVGTGRLLSSEEYGLLLSAFTLLALLSVASSAIMTAVSKREAMKIAVEQPVAASVDQGGLWLRFTLALSELRRDRLAMIAVQIGLVGGLVMCLAAPLVADFLHSGIEVALALAASVPTICTTAVIYGRLQGQQRFQLFAVISLAVAMVKLTLGLGAVATGRGTAAVLVVVAIATLLATIWGLLVVREPGPSGLRALSPEILRILVVLVCWRAIIGMDVPLARFWLTDRVAGQYAAAVVIGRGVLWLPEIVSFVMFPAMASAVAQGKSTRQELIRAIALTLSLCLLGALALWALGPVIFDLLYGSEYPQAAGLSWKVALSSIPTAAANLLMFAALARRESGWIVMLVSAALIQVGLLALFHRNPQQLVLGSAVGGILTLAITFRAATRPTSSVPDSSLVGA